MSRSLLTVALSSALLFLSSPAITTAVTAAPSVSASHLDSFSHSRQLEKLAHRLRVVRDELKNLELEAGEVEYRDADDVEREGGGDDEEENESPSPSDDVASADDWNFPSYRTAHDFKKAVKRHRTALLSGANPLVLSDLKAHANLLQDRLDSPQWFGGESSHDIKVRERAKASYKHFLNGGYNNGGYNNGGYNMNYGNGAYNTGGRYRNGYDDGTGFNNGDYGEEGLGGLHPAAYRGGYYGHNWAGHSYFGPRGLGHRGFVAGYFAHPLR